jgi:hypothetical protein
MLPISVLEGLADLGIVWPVSLCVYVAHHCAIRKGALYLLANWKLCGPNLLGELLKGFIVNPADLPRKMVKRLATSGEWVNHDSQ